MRKNCEDCKYFSYRNKDDKEGQCYIYDTPNYGISYCQDWESKLS